MRSRLDQFGGTRSRLAEVGPSAPWGACGSGGARAPACFLSMQACWVSDVDGLIGRRADQGLVRVGMLSDPSSGDQDPLARVPPTAARPPKGALGGHSWGDPPWVSESGRGRTSIQGSPLESTAIGAPHSSEKFVSGAFQQDATTARASVAPPDRRISCTPLPSGRA